MLRSREDFFKINFTYFTLKLCPLRVRNHEVLKRMFPSHTVATCKIWYRLAL